jgi:truncated hemoglobin YjbI
VHLNNDEIEVACDALWFVKVKGAEDGVQERLWTRLQPIRTGDYGGSVSTKLEPEERDAVVRALESAADEVPLDTDEHELLVRLTADDPA